LLISDIVMSQLVRENVIPSYRDKMRG